MRSRRFLFEQKTVDDASKALGCQLWKQFVFVVFISRIIKLLDKLLLRRVCHLVLVEGFAQRGFVLFFDRVSKYYRNSRAALLALRPSNLRLTNKRSGIRQTSLISFPRLLPKIRGD